MGTSETEIQTQLSSEERLELLQLMLESRHGDLREERLIRQGKGWFQISGAGHEAFGAIGKGLTSHDCVKTLRRVFINILIYIAFSKLCNENLLGGLYILFPNNLVYDL